MFIHQELDVMDANGGQRLKQKLATLQEQGVVILLVLDQDDVLIMRKRPL